MNCKESIAKQVLALILGAIAMALSCAVDSLKVTLHQHPPSPHTHTHNKPKKKAENLGNNFWWILVICSVVKMS